LRVDHADVRPVAGGSRHIERVGLLVDAAHDLLAGPLPSGAAQVRGYGKPTEGCRTEAPQTPRTDMTVTSATVIGAPAFRNRLIRAVLDSPPDRPSVRQLRRADSGGHHKHHEEVARSICRSRESLGH
jgi:hypothetical protein